jgi:hypothetical protein
MTTLTGISHDFETSVGVDEVERLLARVPATELPYTEWTLDLSHCRHVDPGAGFRLGNALQAWSRGRVVVLVPQPGDFSDSWFRNITRSGLGLGIAAHAHEIICDGSDITETVRDYYRGHSSTVAVNYAVESQIESGALVPSRERFGAIFNTLLARAMPRAERWLGNEERVAVIQLAHEAATNIVDHAFQLPWEGADEVVAYFSLRWYQAISSADARVGALPQYIATYQQHLEQGASPAGWLEVVVNDDGVGIAARQSLDRDIYDAPIANEDAALAEAFSVASSVKLKARDAVVRGDPGYGMAIITAALKRLRAYAALRTGRRLIEFDPFSERAEFMIREQVLGIMPGASLHVLIPIVDPQLRLT